MIIVSIWWRRWWLLLNLIKQQRLQTFISQKEKKTWICEHHLDIPLDPFQIRRLIASIHWRMPRWMDSSFNLVISYILHTLKTKPSLLNYLLNQFCTSDTSCQKTDQYIHILNNFLLMTTEKLNQNAVSKKKPFI